jgi:hypothetical protein
MDPRNQDAARKIAEMMRGGGNTGGRHREFHGRGLVGGEGIKSAQTEMLRRMLLPGIHPSNRADGIRILLPGRLAGAVIGSA